MAPCPWEPWSTVPFFDVDTFGDPTGTFVWEGRWVVTGTPIRRETFEDDWSPSPEQQLIWSDGQRTALPSGTFHFYFPWLGWDEASQRLHMVWFEEPADLDQSAGGYPWAMRPTQVWYSNLESPSGSWAAPTLVATDSAGFRWRGPSGLVDSNGVVHFAAQSARIGSAGGLHYITHLGETWRAQLLSSRGAGWQSRIVEHLERVVILSFGNARESVELGARRPGLVLWDIEPSSGEALQSRFAEIPDIVRNPQWVALQSLGDDGVRIVIGNGFDGGFSAFQGFLWPLGSDSLAPDHPALVLPVPAHYPQLAVDACGSSHLVFVKDGMDKPETTVGYALLDGNGWSSPSNLTLGDYPMGLALLSGQYRRTTLAVFALAIDAETERFRDPPMRLLTSRRYPPRDCP
jgi:hypothetical protein